MACKIVGELYLRLTHEVESLRSVANELNQYKIQSESLIATLQQEIKLLKAKLSDK